MTEQKQERHPERCRSCFCYISQTTLFTKTFVHAFFITDPLIFGRHHKAQNNIEQQRRAQTQKGTDKPYKAHICHIPTKILGKTGAHTGQLTVCRTHQSLHCKLLFRKNEEQYQIKQCSSSCKQGCNKPRNAHKLYIQTKEFCHTGTNATNHTVLCRTKQFSHFLLIFSLFITFSAKIANICV